MNAELYAYISKCILCNQFGCEENPVLYLPDGKGVFPICQHCFDFVKGETREDQKQ